MAKQQKLAQFRGMAVIAADGMVVLQASNPEDRMVLFPDQAMLLAQLLKGSNVKIAAALDEAAKVVRNPWARSESTFDLGRVE